MKRKVDVCIVGAAGGGMSAALKAHESGASVLVLEKMAATGGCTKMAGGIMGIDSPIQRAAGLSYSPDEMFRELMTVLNWNCNSNLIRKWLNGAGENIRWLMELGVPFVEAVPFQGMTDSTRSLHHVVASTLTGLEISNALTKACADRGIEILLNTRASSLIRAEDGGICGVTAETKEGETLEIEAAAVVLATGSISYNRDLIARFYNSDEYRDIRIMADAPHNTGDGLIMAESIGAKTDRISTLYIGPHNHFPGASEAMGNIMRRPHLVKLDRNGERFIDESVYSDSDFGWMVSVAVDRLPGKVSYAIMDSALFDSMKAKPENLYYLERRFSRWDKYPMEWMDTIDRSVENEISAGRAFKADSIAELAEFIGCDPAVLEESISRYNAYCEAGHDADFLKKPRYLIPVLKAPFYALRGPSGIDTCIGGLAIDHSQRVLDREDRPIPGLYAAGVLTSGWLAHNYGFFGSEMSYTIYSGRTCGVNAADYAAHNK